MNYRSTLNSVGLCKNTEEIVDVASKFIGVFFGSSLKYEHNVRKNKENFLERKNFIVFK